MNVQEIRRLAELILRATDDLQNRRCKRCRRTRKQMEQEEQDIVRIVGRHPDGIPYDKLLSKLPFYTTGTTHHLYRLAREDKIILYCGLFYPVD